MIPAWKRPVMATTSYRSPYQSQWVPPKPQKPQKLHFEITKDHRARANELKKRKVVWPYIENSIKGWEVTGDNGWMERVREILFHIRNGTIETLGYINNLSEFEVLLAEFAVGLDRWTTEKAMDLIRQIIGNNAHGPYSHLGNERLEGILHPIEILKMKDELCARDVYINPKLTVDFIMCVGGTSTCWDMEDKMKEWITNAANKTCQSEGAKVWFAKEDTQKRLREELATKTKQLQQTEDGLEKYSREVIDGVGLIDFYHQLLEDVDYLRRLGITEN